MKSFIGKILVLLAAASCTVIPGIASAQSGPQIETPAAVVNGVVISPQEVEMEIQVLEAEMDFRNRPVAPDQAGDLRVQVRQALIERELLYQQAQQKNIQIKRSGIEKAIKEFKRRLPGSVSLQGYLTRTGLSEGQLRDRIHKGLMISRFLNRTILKDIKVSDAELQSYYQNHPGFFQRDEQVRARHILIKIPSDASDVERDNALSRMHSLQTRIQEGADFGVIAFEHSDDPSRIRGGDLGFLSRDEMIAPLAEAAFNLQPRQVSDIVNTRYGYHLIQVMERRPSEPVAFRDAREKIEQTLRRNKERTVLQSYVGLLRKKGSVTE